MFGSEAAYVSESIRDPVNNIEASYTGFDIVFRSNILCRLGWKFRQNTGLSGDFYLDPFSIKRSRISLNFTYSLK